MESRNQRTRNKLLAKTTWYKKKPKEDLYSAKPNSKKGGPKLNLKSVNRVKKKTVLFTEQTGKGELAVVLRDVFLRLEPITGFGVKVIERAGSSVKSLLPTSIGEATPCGRVDCISCNQGSEHIPACSRQSVVYENICKTCNPSAGDKKAPLELNKEVPSVYVGESSRSLQERLVEHWRGWRTQSSQSHILKHQVIHHGGEKNPNFVARAVTYCGSALERQVTEAVRIQKRGGEDMILNSKTEYNRSRIPRLVVEQLDEERIEREEEEIAKNTQQDLMNTQLAWEDAKFTKRREERKKISKEKEGKGKESKREKARVFTLIEEDWGHGGVESNVNKKRRVGEEDLAHQKEIEMCAEAPRADVSPSLAPRANVSPSLAPGADESPSLAPGADVPPSLAPATDVDVDDESNVNKKKRRVGAGMF